MSVRRIIISSAPGNRPRCLSRVMPGWSGLVGPYLEQTSLGSGPCQAGKDPQWEGPSPLVRSAGGAGSPRGCGPFRSCRSVEDQPEGLPDLGAIRVHPDRVVEAGYRLDLAVARVAAFLRHPVQL